MAELRAQLPDPPEPVDVATALRANVRRRRNELGLSQRDLAERLKSMGSTLHSTAVAKMETAGRDGKPDRQISAVELVQLAVALEVSPGMLLLPQSDNPYLAPDLRIAPDLTYSSDEARRWIQGDIDELQNSANATVYMIRSMLDQLSEEANNPKRPTPKPRQPRSKN
jgi:transcriptional regulator with XRE-family HTH domain